MAKTYLFLLKALLILIFCSWISLWILNPTQIWIRTWKELEVKAKGTIFSYNSLDFAVFTFPLLALAMIGFVYIQLKSKRDTMSPEKKFNSGLSSPLIIDSTIGILSAIEILCIALFTVFLSWTFYVKISDDFKKIMPYKQFKLNIWQYKVIRVAIRCGLLAEACLALLLLPILRRMAVFKLLGIQFEASVRYHMWIGTSMIIFTIFHAFGIFFIWGIKHHIQDEMWKWQTTGRIYLAGEIAFLAGIAILITSLPQIRRRNFGVFYYTHHLYFVFLISFLFHAGDRHFYMVFPGIFLFGLDKVLRFLQSRTKTCILSARIFPCKAIELILPKDPKLNYTPTSTIFVKIPSISNFQWHPFSITSSSKVDKQTITIIIKSEGWWTTSLYNLILAKLDEEADQNKRVYVSIEGPYGPPSIDFLRYDTLILVAGGIGITPFLSILQELGSMRNDNRHNDELPSRIQLIYVVKKSSQISLLNPILAKKFCLNLKLKVFVTSDKTMGEIVNEVSQIQTIGFDSTSKSTSYAIFGIENSIILAAIIGLGAILFLVFLLSFNHTNFLHSAKNSSKKKVPSFITDAFLLCSFSLAIICSCLMVFFLRCKKLKNDLPSFNYLSDVSTNHNTMEILEGLEEHHIHFGGRPNFEEVFSNLLKEIGGGGSSSSVGVLVCGPKTMKESVASACKVNTQVFSSDDPKKKKLHFSFHSLNFSL